MSINRFSQYEEDTDGKTVIDNFTGYTWEFRTVDYARSCCEILNNIWNENNRLERKNQRLHQDWDKMYRLCLDEGFTEDKIIKELER